MTPMTPHRTLLLGLGTLALATLGSAQITVTATVDQSHVTAGSVTNSFPVGSTITPGTTLSSSLTTPRVANSQIEFIQRNPNRDELGFRVSASASVGTAAGGFGLFTTASSRFEVTLTLVSPIPVPVELELESEWISPSCAGGRSSLTTPFGATSTCLGSPTPCTTTINTVIDSSGFTITMFADAFTSSAGRCFGMHGTTVDAICRIRPRARTTTYGSPCGGVSLSSRANLIDPTLETLEIVDSGQFAFGTLLVGTGQIVAPLPWGCPLRTNFFVSLPIPPGGAELSLPLPSPGVFTMQAGSFGGPAMTVALSNGLAL